MAGEWVGISLADVIDIKHGFAFKGKFFRDEPPGDILLTPGNFAIGGGFKAEKFKYYNGPVPDEFVLHDGDLIVTMTDLSKNADTLGYPAFVPSSSGGRRYLHNQRLGKVVAKHRDTVDLRYVHYVMCTREYRYEVVASATGTTVKHTSPGRIKRFRFRLPPLREQRAIAYILQTLDDKIELNHRMNETLEAIGRAIFRAWFVDFEPVRAKMEGRWHRGESLLGLPDDLWDLFPGCLVDSGLGEIPEGWEVQSLSSLFPHDDDCVLTGPFGSHLHASDYRDEGVPLILVQHVIRGRIIEHDLPLVGQHKLPELERYRLREGDIVFTRVGAVGRSAYVHARFAGWMISGQMLRVRVPDWEIIQPRYLSQAFVEDSFIRMVGVVALGTTRPSLNTSLLLSFRFLVPPRELVNRFVKGVSASDREAQALSEECRTLAALRDALLPKLISGEIGVKDVERIVSEVV